MAQMAADMLNLSPEVLPFSKVNIIVKRFRETPNAIVQSGPFLEGDKRHTMLRQLPSDIHQGRAIFNILRKQNWKQFAILASFTPYGINGVLELQFLATQYGYKIANVQHIKVAEPGSILNITSELNIIRQSLVRIIVLNSNGRVAAEVLEQAASAGLMKEGYQWILTDGVTGSHILLGQGGRGGEAYFPSYLTGLIGTRPHSVEGVAFQNFAANYINSYMTYDGKLPTSPYDLTIFTRLLYDSVWIMGHALHNYFSRGIELYEQRIDCMDPPESRSELAFGQPNYWKNGTQLFNEMLKVRFEGITGNIEFGEDASPYDKSYDIVNFRSRSFEEVGAWSGIDGIHMTRQIVYQGGSLVKPSDVAQSLNGSHLILGIMMEAPFIIKEKGCVGNGCYKGYCIDLIKRLSEDLDFTFELHESKDGRWGGYDNNTGQWDGLVRMLIDKEIDIAAVHLSINSLREKFIDFSVPFMEAGLLFVVKGETHSNANKFFFLSPFSGEVWYCILVVCALVTVVVCLVSKVSPYGKYGAKMHALMTCPCERCIRQRELTIQGAKSLAKPDEFSCRLDELEASSRDQLEQLSMFNSSWMVIASLLNQSPLEGPYCASGRFILMAWWFFMMIVTAMYTANLAAFLTVSRLHVGLRGVEDLLKQDEFKWGTVFSTNPELLMRNSVKSSYRQLIENAINVTNADQGYMKAASEKFAFIYESPYLEYKQQISCDNITDLISVGEQFHEFGLAFGVQQNAPFADVLNHKILSYKETGWLEALWQKWLTEGVDCSDNEHTDFESMTGSVETRSSTLDMSYLSGLFMTLAVMCFMGLIIVVLEISYASILDVWGTDTPLLDEECTILRTVEIEQKGILGRFRGALGRRMQLLRYDISTHWWKIHSLTRFKSSTTLKRSSATQTSSRHKCLSTSRTGTPRQHSDSGLLIKTPEPKGPVSTRRGSLPSTPGIVRPNLLRTDNIELSDTMSHKVLEISYASILDVWGTDTPLLDEECTILRTVEIEQKGVSTLSHHISSPTFHLTRYFSNNNITPSRYWGGSEEHWEGECNC
nr:ionotropic glutamate receptor-9 [Pleurobrachia bachei]